MKLVIIFLLLGVVGICGFLMVGQLIARMSYPKLPPKEDSNDRNKKNGTTNTN